MNDAELKEIIKANAGDNGLNCATAFSIAKKHDVSLQKIGDVCNEMGIKIRNCQLGCFK